MNPGKHVDSSQTTLTLAMKWSSAVLVTTVTSYITRATQMPPTIYDFSYKMAHLVTMDPN